MRKNRIFIVLTTALLALCGLGTPTVKAAYLPSLSNWAVEEVTSLDERGVIPDALKSNFQSPICRDEFTALLVNVYEYIRSPVTTGASPFNDISESEYKTAIEKAKKLGLVDGTSAIKFTPAGLLTREQSAKMLFAMESKLKNATLDNWTPNYNDSWKISEWAVPYVAYAQRYGLMLGSCNGNFKPQGSLTREESMLVAERLIAQYKPEIPWWIQEYEENNKPISDESLFEEWLIIHWDLFNEAKDKFWEQEFQIWMDSPEDVAILQGDLSLDIENRALLTKLYSECHVIEIETYFNEPEEYWGIAFKVVGAKNYYGQGIGYGSKIWGSSPDAIVSLMGEGYVGEWHIIAWDLW